MAGTDWSGVDGFGDRAGQREVLAACDKFMVNRLGDMTIVHFNCPTGRRMWVWQGSAPIHPKLPRAALAKDGCIISDDEARTLNVALGVA